MTIENRVYKKIMFLSFYMSVCFLIFIHSQVLATNPEGIYEKKYKDTTGFLPELQTQKHLEILEKSFNKVVPLVNTLDGGNEKIRQLIDQYRANPTFENQAKLENAMASHVTRVLDAVDSFLGTRDEVIWSLSDLKGELKNFAEKVGKRTEEVQNETINCKKEIDAIDRNLVKLAQSIKQDPENQGLRENFRKNLYAMRLSERRYAENSNNVKLMKSWCDALVKLQDSISKVHQEVSVLMDCLQDERKMFVYTVKARAESVELTRKIRDGLVTGENSIGEIAKKIQTLYQGIQNFMRVSEEIDKAFTEKSPAQSAVNELIKSLDSIPSVDDSVESEVETYGQK